MLAQAARAEKSGEGIVFLGWEPHPMNKNLEMVYLTGGDDLFGPNLGGATVDDQRPQGLRRGVPERRQVPPEPRLHPRHGERDHGGDPRRRRRSPEKAAGGVARGQPRRARALARGRDDAGRRRRRGRGQGGGRRLMRGLARPRPSADRRARRAAPIAASWEDRARMDWESLEDSRRRLGRGGRRLADRPWRLVLRRPVGNRHRRSSTASSGAADAAGPRHRRGLRADRLAAPALARGPSRSSLVGFAYILNQGYWEETTETLTLVLSSVIVCMGFGVPIGIACAHRPRLYAFAPAGARPDADAADLRLPDPGDRLLRHRHGAGADRDDDLRHPGADPAHLPRHHHDAEGAEGGGPRLRRDRRASSCARSSCRGRCRRSWPG